MNPIHEAFMDEALALAERGRGWTSPNPMVGAVVVRDSAAIGRGWHRQFGGPHAEVFALREAGELARGATLYCTLEPCNHTGKTPPCVQAIVGAGIKTVVLGARDPNPAAAGGINVLRKSGVSVIEGVREPECRRLNAAFFKHVQTGLPFVSLKWAMSLDGKIACASGDSKWITGSGARQHAHRLRARHDAVLAGVGTVLADDPALNVRLDDVAGAPAVRQPKRIILDSRARTPLDGRLWSIENGGPLIILCARGAEAPRKNALRQRGAEVLELDTNAAGRIPILEAMKELGARGIVSVMVEGGSGVLGEFTDARAADRIHVFIAPKILGGAKSFTVTGGAGADSMTRALQVTQMASRHIGDDILVEGALSQWGL